MTEEDREQLSKYGRLLSKREMEELSDPDDPEQTGQSAVMNPPLAEDLPQEMDEKGEDDG